MQGSGWVYWPAVQHGASMPIDPLSLAIGAVVALVPLLAALWSLQRRLTREQGEQALLQERLEHELAIIEHLGFASYFLTVAEVASIMRVSKMTV